ncbi:MAG: GyrI-like domain-containing protein [Treponema sp.]|nr:GyrI-like domain-containing protein [Treponema sp.]
MKAKIIKKPAIKLAGFLLKTKELTSFSLSRFSVKELTSYFWHDCITNGSLQKLNNEPFIKNNNQYGICVPVEKGDHEFEYVIGIEVKDGADIPKEYHVCTIPEVMYAVFRTKPADNNNFANVIDRAWVSIIMDWLPKSGYEYLDNKADFCFYDARYNNKKSNVCEIYLPVIKKLPNKSLINEKTETKKCKNCLRRVDVHYNRCPYCRRDDFQFDSN